MERDLARKMHRLGRISPKALIFRAIKIAIQINTVFAEPHRPWLVTCFSWVPITCPRHGRFNVNDRHAKAIVDMPARSDSLVFSGSQTCGILLS